MSTTSFAVLAKARAKYGRFLSEHDYDGILACQSVPEVMVYLKTNTHFAPILSGVDEREVHRGRLETLLRQYQFNEFDSMCRYDSSVSEGFSRFVIERTEVEQLVHFMVLLNSQSTDTFIFRFPAFLAKHTEIDFERLATVNDYSTFLDVIAHTSYHEELKKYRPDNKGRLPVAHIENNLYGLIFDHMIAFINKKTKGTERQELTDIFRKLYDLKPDVIILARGGVSAEDLWCFNDEMLVRAVAESPVPLITGVGHEVDTTLVDYASDVRAPTPTGAAVRAVPALEEIIFDLSQLESRLDKAAGSRLQQLWLSVDLLEKRLTMQSPEAKIANEKRALDQLTARLQMAQANYFMRQKNALEGLEKRLSALNPENVMKRGYAFVRQEEKVVTSAAELDTGDRIRIRFFDGEKSAVVD